MATFSPIVLLVFTAGSIPLVWQDLRSLSVSQGWLFLFLGGSIFIAWWSAPSWVGAAALSAGVLLIGTVFLMVAPQTLGEADIVYMAAIAWILPFWSFLLAMGLSCLLGLVAFVWLSRGGRRDITGVAIPYLPCLALGGLGILGAN